MPVPLGNSNGGHRRPQNVRETAAYGRAEKTLLPAHLITHRGFFSFSSSFRRRSACSSRQRIWRVHCVAGYSSANSIRESREGPAACTPNNAQRILFLFVFLSKKKCLFPLATRMAGIEGRDPYVWQCRTERHRTFACSPWQRNEQVLSFPFISTFSSGPASPFFFFCECFFKKTCPPAGATSGAFPYNYFWTSGTFPYNYFWTSGTLPYNYFWYLIYRKLVKIVIGELLEPWNPRSRYMEQRWVPSLFRKFLWTCLYTWQQKEPCLFALATKWTGTFFSFYPCVSKRAGKSFFLLLWVLLKMTNPFVE